MAQPLYFLPAVTMTRETALPARREILVAHGLMDVFADVKMESLGFNNLSGIGPGNKSGVIVFYTSPVTDIPRRIGYFPDEQTWHPVDDGSLLWIGLDNTSPPTPDDLRRTKTFTGYEIELGDGNLWDIPVIRCPADESTSLPATQYVERGKFVRTIKAAYKQYWEESVEIADWFFSGEKKEMPIVRLHELCVRAIGINYRFGENEQRLMSVVDSENWMALLGCTVDFNKVQAMGDVQKKSEPLIPEQLNI